MEKSRSEVYPGDPAREKLPTPEATRHEDRDLLALACTPISEGGRDAAALRCVGKSKLRRSPRHTWAVGLLLQIVGVFVFVMARYASAKTIAVNLFAGYEVSKMIYILLE